MSSSVAMLLARCVAAGGREKKRPWQKPPRPRSSPCRSAFAASIETNSVDTWHRSRRGLESGVVTASSGVQLLCESCVCQRVSCRLRGVHECRRVRFSAQVVVQALHPKGRPDLHPTHMLKQATKLSQGCRVCAVRQGVLDALHGSEGFIARKKKHSRSRHEHDPKPEDRGTRLSCWVSRSSGLGSSS
eukprot:2249194-Pleurochrysis_carterae.AAC.9